MDRRSFLQTAGVGVGAALIGASALSAEAASNQASPQAESTKTTKEKKPMKVILAADPIALELKDAILAHVKEKGHEVIDVGSTTDKPSDYFDCAQTACQMLQRGEADRAILFCGTGMGMSIIANKFARITAAVVESIHAAKMCRAINDANVLTMGSMCWGVWNAKLAVDAFLETEMADTLPAFADYLTMAKKKVEAIDEANRK